MERLSHLALGWPAAGLGLKWLWGPTPGSRLGCVCTCWGSQEKRVCGALESSTLGEHPLRSRVDQGPVAEASVSRLQEGILVGRA